MDKTKPKLAIFAVVLALLIFWAGYGLAILTTSKNLSSTATLISDVNLSIYENPTATVELTTVGWGIILPTQTLTARVWLQNDAAIDMLISVSTKDWLPSGVEQTMSFTAAKGAGWDNPPNYPILLAHRRCELVFTLTAFDNATTGSVAFTITITGTTV